MISVAVKVGSADGIHARPASQIVQVAAESPSEIVIREVGGKSAAANSILSLLSLGAAQGQSLFVEAPSEDASEFVEKVVAIIASAD